MKSLLTRGVTVVALCSALGFATSTAAYAEGRSAHAASLVDHGTSSQLSARDHGTVTSPTLNQARSQRQYDVALRAINRQFERSVAEAQSEFTLSLVGARTASDKLAARTAFRTAVAHATSERELALKSLGRRSHKSRPDLGSRDHSH